MNYNIYTLGKCLHKVYVEICINLLYEMGKLVVLYYNPCFWFPMLVILATVSIAIFLCNCQGSSD